MSRSGMKDLESNLEKILQSQASQPDSTGLTASVNQECKFIYEIGASSYIGDLV